MWPPSGSRLAGESGKRCRKPQPSPARVRLPLRPLRLHWSAERLRVGGRASGAAVRPQLPEACSPVQGPASCQPVGSSGLGSEGETWPSPQHHPETDVSGRGACPSPTPPLPPQTATDPAEGASDRVTCRCPFVLSFFFAFKCVFIIPMKSHILLKNPRGVFLKYDQKEGRRQARADAVAFRGPARGLGGFGGKAREQGAVRLSRNWPARHPSRSRPVTEIGGSSRAGRRPLNLPGAWLAPLDTEESSSVTDRY